VREDHGKKLGPHLAVEQPVAVLGERGRVPHRVLDPEPNKPAKQQVEVDAPDHPQLVIRRDPLLQTT